MKVFFILLFHLFNSLSTLCLELACSYQDSESEAEGMALINQKKKSTTVTLEYNCKCSKKELSCHS